MKWLVWLLLVINVGIFGFFKLQAMPPVESRVGHEPINPEKLKILSPDELAALPRVSLESSPSEPVPSGQAPSTSSLPTAPPTSSPQAQTSPAHVHSCYDWGSFSTADLARARHALDKFKLDVSVKQQTTKDATRYWIYIPPRKSMEDAQTKVGELSALGVDESFIVEEPKWRFAISLAMYKDEALANRFLAELHKRGVRSAVKGVRNFENGQSSFHIRNLAQEVADEIGKLQPDFPGSELKPVECP